MQDCPNPSKVAICVLAGSSLACSSSSSKAHARRCCVREAAHGHSAWAARLVSWATLGSTAPSREGLAQCCLCYRPRTMASPGKNSTREPRAVGFTSHLQGLTRWNPNIWSHTFFCYPRRAAGWMALCCNDPQHVWGKISSAELNKTRPGNLTLVFNPNTTLILIETTV